MPLSRRRKKKGKLVQHDAAKRAQRLEEADITSGVSLQDLIDVVAYQEYVKDGTIYVPEVVPVTIGEGVDKREVGTATSIHGDEEHLSINITDPDVLKMVQGPMDHYSIDKENKDER